MELNNYAVGFVIENVKIKKQSHEKKLCRRIRRCKCKNQCKCKNHFGYKNEQNIHQIINNENNYDAHVVSQKHCYDYSDHSSTNSHCDSDSDSDCNEDEKISMKISKHNFISSSLGDIVVVNDAWKIYKKNINNYLHVSFILTFTRKHHFGSLIFKLTRIKHYKKCDKIKLYFRRDNSYRDCYPFYLNNKCKLKHKCYKNIRFYYNEKKCIDGDNIH